MPHKQIQWSDKMNTERRLKENIKDLKLHYGSGVRMDSLPLEEQSELSALHIQTKEDSQDYVIEALQDAGIESVILHWLTHYSKESDAQMLDALRKSIADYRKEAVNDLIENTNEHCCGECVSGDDQNCDCELGICSSCTSDDDAESYDVAA